MILQVETFQKTLIDVYVNEFGNNYCRHPKARNVFITEDIFQMETWKDTDFCDAFAPQAIQLLQAIVEGHAGSFISKSKHLPKDYILLMNLPFFKNGVHYPAGADKPVFRPTFETHPRLLKPFFEDLPPTPDGNFDLESVYASLPNFSAALYAFQFEDESRY